MKACLFFFCGLLFIPIIACKKEEALKMNLIFSGQNLKVFKKYTLGNFQVFAQKGGIYNDSSTIEHVFLKITSDSIYYNTDGKVTVTCYTWIPFLNHGQPSFMISGYDWVPEQIKDGILILTIPGAEAYGIALKRL